MKNPAKRISIKTSIPADTMNALKSEAAARGCTVEAVAHDIVMAYVSK
jgi:hypothetical protein